MSLKYVLLTLLEREPRTGYDLVQTFDSAVGYFWNASHQQVYRELGALADAKLLKFKQVKQADKPDKKIYSLSATGKATLHEWLEHPLKAEKTKDLLLVKLMNTSSATLEQMQRELSHNKQNAKAIQATYSEIKNQYYSPKQLKVLPPNEVMIYAALRKGMLSVEAHLKWLDEVELLLKKNFT